MIRQLTETDLAHILVLQHEAYPPPLVESEGTFRSKFRLFPEGILGAFEDGELVAYTIVHPWTHGKVVHLHEDSAVLPERPDCLYLHDLVVRRNRRGRGFARALVGRVFVLAGELGLSKFTLVAVQNSEPFWAGFGFEEAERFEYRPGVGATRMTLER